MFLAGFGWHQACRVPLATVILCPVSRLGSFSRPAALFALGASLLLPARASAAEAEPAAPASARASVPVLLRDSSRLAAWLASHSPEIRVARARLAQSQADTRTSHLLLNPVLDASLGNVPVGQTNPPGLGFNETAIYTVGLSETIELGKRGPRIAGAELRAKSSALQLVMAERDQQSVARFALGDTLHRGLRVAIFEESLKDAEGAADLERTRYEQKALSGTEYDRLLLDLANLRADFERERAEYGAALADCAAALGADCELSGAREDDLSGAAPLDIAQASAPGLERRPDLQALDAERQAAERDAALARGRAIPDLTLRVAYTHDRFVASGDNRNTLTFGVALPLPVFDRGQHDSSRALSRAAELRDTRLVLLRQARADLSGLLTRKATLEKVLAALEHESLPRSSSVLQSTQTAFDHGGVSLTDLLLARRTHIALQLTLLDERFELFGIRNELNRVLALGARNEEKKP
jgi:cobalt-zinc-cadmium efflux system outer membrane protein